VANPSEHGKKLTLTQLTMSQIGHKLLSDSKAAEATSEKAREKMNVRRCDLLSLLFRANTTSGKSKKKIIQT
jgi:hypothetical protein